MKNLIIKQFVMLFISVVLSADNLNWSGVKSMPVKIESQIEAKKSYKNAVEVKEKHQELEYQKEWKPREVKKEYKQGFIRTH